MYCPPLSETCWAESLIYGGVFLGSLGVTLLLVILLNSFQQALEYQPSSAECHLNLANCLSQSLDSDKKRSHNLLLKVIMINSGLL